MLAGRFVRRSGVRLLAATIVAAAAFPASGQTAETDDAPPPEEPAYGAAEATDGSDGTAAGDDATYGPSLWQRAFGTPDLDPGYRLSFRMLRDIPLPGPLPDGVPRLVGDRVRLNVDGGVATIDWGAEAPTEILPPPDEADDEPVWAVDPDGKVRARFIASGHLLVEKRCKRCRQVWRRKWKLKVSGTNMTRPLLTGSRIYFGAQDNRVYSVRKRNGHRLWVSDLGQRVSRPVVLWQGKIDVEREDGSLREKQVQVILVLPDAGSVLVALDARGGREMARYELKVEEGRLVGVPLGTPDGRIVVAREKYSATDASLMVLTLESGNGTDDVEADDGEAAPSSAGAGTAAAPTTGPATSPPPAPAPR